MIDRRHSDEESPWAEDSPTVARTIVATVAALLLTALFVVVSSLSAPNSVDHAGTGIDYRVPMP